MKFQKDSENNQPGREKHQAAAETAAARQAIEEIGVQRSGEPHQNGGKEIGIGDTARIVIAQKQGDADGFDDICGKRDQKKICGEKKKQADLAAADIHHPG